MSDYFQTKLKERIEDRLSDLEMADHMEELKAFVGHARNNGDFSAEALGKMDAILIILHAKYKDYKRTGSKEFFSTTVHVRH